MLQVANVKAIADERHLHAALPLGQNGRVRVPLLLYATQACSSAVPGLALGPAASLHVYVSQALQCEFCMYCPLSSFWAAGGIVHRNRGC